MITIQIDGKTYKTMNESIEKTIRSYVWPWCLEEVKENKEPDTSILEKLRNELEKIYKDTIGKKHEENSPEHYKAYGQYLMYQRLDSFLRSLETHQFTPWKEDFSELPKINDTNLLEEAWEPIEDKIELLPEFIAYPHKESWHIYDIDRNAEQIELLTNAINKLINR